MKNRSLFLSILLTIVTCFYSLNARSSCNFNITNVDSFDIDSTKKLIIIGEYHYQRGNYELMYMIFEKALKKNFRVLLYECSHSKAFLINEFIKEENVEFSRRSIFWGEERIFLQKLRLLYKSLSPQDRFVVEGLDIEKESIYSEEAIKYIYNKSIFLNSITVQHFKKFNDFTNGELSGGEKIEWIDAITAISEGIQNNKIVFEKDLGSNYSTINRIIEKLISDYPISKHNLFLSKNAEKLEPREERMFINLIDVYKRHPSAKCFGQFGITHISQVTEWNWGGIKNWESFVARFKKRNQFRDEVTSILIFHDSFFLK